MTEAPQPAASSPSGNMVPGGASVPQQGARFVLALLLTLAGVWTLHRYLPALVWAAILAIAVWPLYQRAMRRWPPGKHNILLPGVFTAALGLVFIMPLVMVAVSGRAGGARRLRDHRHRPQ